MSDRFQTIGYIEAAERIDDFAPWKRKEKKERNGNLGLQHACKDVFGAMIKGKMGSMGIGSLVPFAKTLAGIQYLFFVYSRLQ